MYNAQVYIVRRKVGTGGGVETFEVKLSLFLKSLDSSASSH